jgi:fructose-1,6-bisphosphatase/inositol monophosphatase family enzyme
VKINEVMNACVTLSQSTGPTVRKVMQSNTGLNTKQKGLCKYDVCTEADLKIQKTIQHNLKALFPRAKIICEEEDSSIDESMAPSLQPDQVLRTMKRQSIFTPEILSYSANVRKHNF